MPHSSSTELAIVATKSHVAAVRLQASSRLLLRAPIDALNVPVLRGVLRTILARVRPHRIYLSLSLKTDGACRDAVFDEVDRACRRHRVRLILTPDPIELVRTIALKSAKNTNQHHYA